MKDVPYPKAAAPSVDVLSRAQLRRLLDTCSGAGFSERRDAAIIRLFLDSGMRRAELSSLTVENVDLDALHVLVMGKGRRQRVVPVRRQGGAGARQIPAGPDEA